jgi:NADH-quinone oxidoreductase subunit E
MILGGSVEMQNPLDFTQADEILNKRSGGEELLISILQELQEIYGYLPEELLNKVGKRLRLPMSRIYGVITFYAQFYTTPRGRHTVRVCRGTACHVRGGKQVLKTVHQRLGIGENETTSDFKFTFETVACLGACALSPVLLVDKTYYGKLTPAKVEQVLKQYV